MNHSCVKWFSLERFEKMTEILKCVKNYHHCSSLRLKREQKDIFGLYDFYRYYVKTCSDRNFHVLPKQAQVVICGAGTVANSVAYHLVQNGWNDILVLEKEKIGSGTSYFGSGTLGLFKPIAERNLVMYSIKLYRQLSEMGYDIGFKQCGSVNLAHTRDRMTALRRRMAYHQATGLHCEVVNNIALTRLHPFLHTDDLEGAIWVPEDAVAHPLAVCEVLAQLAKEGAKMLSPNFGTPGKCPGHLPLEWGLRKNKHCGY